MTLDYNKFHGVIIKRLELAHDPDVAKIRSEFFKQEYSFFQKYIFNKNVLVAGSGLGHDSFELAKYNKKVVGVELINSFVEYSKKQLQNLGLDNVVFQQGDINNLNFSNNEFDVAVLNMGTIGNFDNKQDVISELLRVSKVVYFDFYPPLKKGLEKRKKMYSEEKWINVRIKDTRIVSDDGLDSISLSKKEINSIIKPLNVTITYHKFYDFALMAEIIK